MSIFAFFHKILPFDLDLLPPDSYLVGGAVRDALLGRQRKYLDLDFVLPKDVIETARLIANRYQAGFVVLDAKRHIARVVFADATVDFAQQEGNSLMVDLQRRDYRLNAIALNLYNKKIIDPLNGQEDLKKGIINMVSLQNLKDDPLRLLRAYRQAAQLNFKIGIDTRQAIKKTAPLVKNVAVERVKTELDYLLENPQGSYWLQRAYEDNILSYWFKNITPKKIDNLLKIDDVINLVSKKYSQFSSFDYSYYRLAKLCCLIADNPEIAKQELTDLKCSNYEIKTVINIIKYLPQFLDYNCDFPLRDQYFFFLDIEDAFPLLVVNLMLYDTDQQILETLINRYFDPKDLVAHPQPLITGNDLINNLNIKPSPLIKHILTEVQIAYIENKISTKDEALNLAKSFI